MRQLQPSSDAKPGLQQQLCGALRSQSYVSDGGCTSRPVVIMMKLGCDAGMTR